nr:hypothetical protein [Salinispora arenicola]
MQATHQVRVCVIHPQLTLDRTCDLGTAGDPRWHERNQHHADPRPQRCAPEPTTRGVRRRPSPPRRNPATHPRPRCHVAVEFGRRAGIASLGIIGGDPRLASAELGEAIITSALDASDQVLQHL